MKTMTNEFPADFPYRFKCWWEISLPPVGRLEVIVRKHLKTRNRTLHQLAKCEVVALRSRNITQNYCKKTVLAFSKHRFKKSK